MRYQFHVFHNREAIEHHLDFVNRQKLGVEREELEYEHFMRSLPRELRLVYASLAFDRAQPERGIIVTVETEVPAFRVGLALAEVCVKQNSRVDGLFLDFVQK